MSIMQSTMLFCSDIMNHMDSDEEVSTRVWVRYPAVMGAGGSRSVWIRLSKRCLAVIGLTTLVVSFFILALAVTQDIDIDIDIDSSSVPNVHSSPIFRPPAVASTDHISLSRAAPKANNKFQETELWSKIQQQLCPAKVPNSGIGGHSKQMFALARQELGIPNDEFEATIRQRQRQEAASSNHARIRSREELTYRFFQGGEFQPSTVFVPNQPTLSHEDHHSDTPSPLSPRLVYVNIWKAADTAIQQWLEATLGESTQGNVTTMSFHQLFDSEQIVNDPPPCMVTAIRDPVSHFLSGYNEIEFRRAWLLLENDSNTNNHPPTPGGSRRLPLYWNMSSDTHRQRMDRFEQFVHDVATEDSHGLQHYIYKHVFSMSRVLYELSKHTRGTATATATNGGGLTGYLPSLDHLEERFPAFLQETCSSALPTDTEIDYAGGRAKYSLANFGTHPSSLDQDGFYRAAKEVWAKGGKVAKALCVLHAMDYACWDDDADTGVSVGIPPICRELFSSPRFASNILGSEMVLDILSSS